MHIAFSCFGHIWHKKTDGDNKLWLNLYNWEFDNSRDGFLGLFKTLGEEGAARNATSYLPVIASYSGRSLSDCDFRTLCLNPVLTAIE